MTNMTFASAVCGIRIVVYLFKNAVSLATMAIQTKNTASAQWDTPLLNSINLYKPVGVTRDGKEGTVRNGKREW